LPVAVKPDDDAFMIDPLASAAQAAHVGDLGGILTTPGALRPLRRAPACNAVVIETDDTRQDAAPASLVHAK
jgi:hypothetical protein